MKSTSLKAYRVRSRNARGASAWSAPQTTVVHPTGWQIVTAQDFESNSAFPGDWDLHDKNGYADGQYRWGRRDCKTSGSTFSGWATGGGLNGAQTACGANYPNGVESWMVYGPFDLSQVVATELNLRAWYDTERFRDYLYLVASVDDDTFYGERTYGPSDGWKSLTLNLDRAGSLGSLLGQPQVWVALAFESDSSRTRPEGVHVDDVLLRVCLREPCPRSYSDPTVVTEPAFKRRPRAGE